LGEWLKLNLNDGEFIEFSRNEMTDSFRIRVKDCRKEEWVMQEMVVDAEEMNCEIIIHLIQSARAKISRGVQFEK
jgi:hypothetical protein